MSQKPNEEQLDMFANKKSVPAIVVGVAFFIAMVAFAFLAGFFYGIVSRTG